MGITVDFFEGMAIMVMLLFLMLCFATYQGCKQQSKEQDGTRIKQLAEAKAEIKTMIAKAEITKLDK